jgi:hypothetical protein
MPDLCASSEKNSNSDTYFTDLDLKEKFEYEQQILQPAAVNFTAGRWWGTDAVCPAELQ